MRKPATIGLAAVIAFGGVLSPARLGGETNGPAPPVQPSFGPTAPTLSADPETEREFHRILDADDDAQGDAARWTDEAVNPADPVVAPSIESVRRRIEERMKSIRANYQDFLKRQPNHVRAHLAFASFLSENGEVAAAISEAETARALDPANPAAWNNLGGLYAHHGPIDKSFSCYEEAIRLKPDLGLYHNNFGGLLLTARAEAARHYQLSDGAVFSKASAACRRAAELDPGNFKFAADWAQTFYGLKPAAKLDEAGAAEAALKLGDEALNAWTNALRIANEDSERQGIYIHFARWNLRLGRTNEARVNLSVIGPGQYADLKRRLEGLIEPAPSGATNNPGSAPTSPSPMKAVPAQE